ncbi:cobalamin B12-binding domain-containing protein [archaeon]|nr:cobalamin B12-binding domain-containing protein [archaeon]
MNKNILYIHPYCNRDNSDFLFLPAGIVGVINNLRKKGFNVTGLNLPLEMKLNPNINIREAIEEIDFQIVIMDCHWYYFLYGVQEVARLCKEINPGCFVIVGGFSANFFRKNLLQSTDKIDIIVRGDSETTIINICSELLLKGKKAIKKLPNLTYENMFWQAKDTNITSFDNDINKFDYVDLSFMKNWQEYLAFKQGEGAPGIGQIRDLKNFYYLPTQKGCLNSCPSCGGSKFSYEILANKRKACIRSPQNIIDDLKRLEQLDVKKIMVSCESKLNDWGRILGYINITNTTFNLVFEDWQLPNKETAKEMCKYGANTDSGFIVSVLTGNEILRFKNGKKYKNEEVIDFAKQISESGTSYVAFWFSPNLVGGTKKDFKETIRFAKKLVELNRLATKPNIQVMMSSMEVDITSLVYSNPKKLKFSGKVWDYEYIIKMLKFREEGKKLGNMSYCSEEISIEEGNNMCEEFNKEISELKKEIYEFRKNM